MGVTYGIGAWWPGVVLAAGWSLAVAATVYGLLRTFDIGVVRAATWAVGVTIVGGIVLVVALIAATP